jgi:GTPase
VLSRETREDGGSRLLVRVAPERFEEVKRRYASAAPLPQGG